jgi:hypothetical protein
MIQPLSQKAILQQQPCTKTQFLACQTALQNSSQILALPGALSRLAIMSLKVGVVSSDLLKGYGAVRNLSNRGWLPYLAVSGLTIISIFSRILHQKSSALFEWKDLTPRQTAFQ